MSQQIQQETSKLLALPTTGGGDGKLPDGKSTLPSRVPFGNFVVLTGGKKPCNMQRYIFGQNYGKWVCQALSVNGSELPDGSVNFLFYAAEVVRSLRNTYTDTL